MQPPRSWQTAVITPIATGLTCYIMNYTKSVLYSMPDNRRAVVTPSYVTVTKVKTSSTLIGDGAERVMVSLSWQH